MSWILASDIAERIRDLREFLGAGPKGSLSQEDLGKRAGVRPSQVSQWERGVQQPSKSRLESWAEREGWPVTIFADGEPKPSETLAPTPLSTRSSGTTKSKVDLSDPDEILARFYRLMATAAESGTPWPAELANLMDALYRVANEKRSSPLARPGCEDEGHANSTHVPGW